MDLNGSVLRYIGLFACKRTQFWNAKKATMAVQPVAGLHLRLKLAHVSSQMPTGLYSRPICLDGKVDFQSYYAYKFRAAIRHAPGHITPAVPDGEKEAPDWIPPPPVKGRRPRCSLPLLALQWRHGCHQTPAALVSVSVALALASF